MDMRTVIVEDDILSAEYMRILCDTLGADVVGVAHDGDSAVDIIMDTRPAWVLMDLRLGEGKDGVEVAHIVHREMPDTKVIFVTASNESAAMARIVTDHPYRILIKPTVQGDLAEAFGLA